MIFEATDIILRPANIEFAENLLEYYIRNKAFLEDFEPKRDVSFYTLKNQKEQLQQEMTDADKKSASRFYISTKEDARTIIGCIGLNNIVWGCFLSCFLGYKLDSHYINKGYMTQAVGVVANYAFNCLHLHRIEGNVMPRNKASRRVLEKCGFKEEGLSKKYLKINDIWEDHIHMVLFNENM